MTARDADGWQTAAHRLRAGARGIRQDARFAARQFARCPATAALAVITLALGIGANTAISSVVHRLLLAPLPYPNGGGIVMPVEARAPGAGARLRARRGAGQPAHGRHGQLRRVAARPCRSKADRSLSSASPQPGSTSDCRGIRRRTSRPASSRSSPARTLQAPDRAGVGATARVRRPHRVRRRPSAPRPPRADRESAARARGRPARRRRVTRPQADSRAPGSSCSRSRPTPMRARHAV